MLKERAYIANVRVSGFKAIGEEIELELAPLTIFFGPNATGKTSVIEAIYLGLQRYFGGEELPGPIRLHERSETGHVEISILHNIEKHKLCKIILTPTDLALLPYFDEEVKSRYLDEVLKLSLIHI